MVAPNIGDVIRELVNRTGGVRRIGPAVQPAKVCNRQSRNLVINVFRSGKEIWIAEPVLASLVGRPAKIDFRIDSVLAGGDQRLVDPIRRKRPDPVDRDPLVGQIKKPRCVARLGAERERRQTRLSKELSAPADLLLMGGVEIKRKGVLYLIGAVRSIREPIVVIAVQESGNGVG